LPLRGVVNPSDPSLFGDLHRLPPLPGKDHFTLLKFDFALSVFHVNNVFGINRHDKP
jgi:hypothetical protein